MGNQDDGGGTVKLLWRITVIENWGERETSNDMYFWGTAEEARTFAEETGKDWWTGATEDGEGGWVDSTGHTWYVQHAPATFVEVYLTDGQVTLVDLVLALRIQGH